jgi:hypothetical protein
MRVWTKRCAPKTRGARTSLPERASAIAAFSPEKVEELGATDRAWPETTDTPACGQR